MTAILSPPLKVRETDFVKRAAKQRREAEMPLISCHLHVRVLSKKGVTRNSSHSNAEGEALFRGIFILKNPP
jgi:hypothetical protein